MKKTHKTKWREKALRLLSTSKVKLQNNKIGRPHTRRQANFVLLRGLFSLGEFQEGTVAERERSPSES